MIHLTILITQIRYLSLSLGYLVASCTHGRCFFSDCFLNVMILMLSNIQDIGARKLQVFFQNFSACVLPQNVFFPNEGER